MVLVSLSLIDLHVSKFLVYVATGKSATAATITLTKVGTTSSHWKIKIREIGSAEIVSDRNKILVFLPLVWR